MVNVGQLRAALADYPDDLPVVVWEDGDGTRGASPLITCRPALYGATPQTSYQADVYRLDDEDAPDTAEDPYRRGRRAVVVAQNPAAPLTHWPARAAV